MANLEQTTSVNLKLSRILMAWDLVQTNMIDSWTDMLVMKKKKRTILKPDWGQTFTPCFIVTS